MATITRPHEVGKPVICGSKQATKTFIPYKRFNGKNGQSVAFCIPKVLVRYPGLSWGAKACWGVLALRAGEKGLCIPSQTTIADDMGESVRSVRNYLEELGAKGFIHGRQNI